MKLRWPWGKTYYVTCPDGTVRTIYRDLDDACPLYIQGWKADLRADLSGMNDVSADIRAKYETQIDGLLFQLNEQNQSLMISFRTVYLAFTTNPCGNDAFFQRQIEKLLDEQRRLSALKLQISALIKMMAADPANTTAFATVFREIAMRAGGEAIAPAASIEIAETRAIARDLLLEGEK